MSPKPHLKDERDAGALRLVHEHISDVALVSAILFFSSVFYLLFYELDLIRSVSEDTLRGVTMSVGAVLGIFSFIGGYRRFFKGRMFARRANIDISTVCSCILPKDTLVGTTVLEHECSLQVFDVYFENIGQRTLWAPDYSIKTFGMNNEPLLDAALPPDEFEISPDALSVNAIEPGEKICVHKRVLVPRNTPIIRVVAELKVASGDTWSRSWTRVTSDQPTA